MLVVMMLLVGLIPSDVVIESQVDVVEINHFYDNQARLVFDQIIFYDWSYVDNRYQVIGWRLIKGTNQIPNKVYGTNYYQSIWYDDGVLRRLRTKVLRETWTQNYDPELLERESCPKEYRKGLRKPIRKIPLKLELHLPSS